MTSTVTGRLETFRMPDAGEGLTEAEIIGWRVAVGDTVVVNQIIVEIETAKAAVELPSPYAGRVHELLVPPGVTVAVGTPIVTIDTGPDTAPIGGSAATPAPPAAGPPADGRFQAGRSPPNRPGPRVVG